MNEHNLQNSKTQFGFWIYIMTDCVLFAALFVTYAVLHANTFGGPTAQDVFNLPYVLIETLILLTSSFTTGLALIALQKEHRNQVLGWLVSTFILGAIFLGMEMTEFSKLLGEGASFTRSGFLSGFFTLVGTHGLHIAAGLLWIIVLFAQLIKKGLTPHTVRRVTLFTLFWHFLDIIWIFIFTTVYLMGKI